MMMLDFRSQLSAIMTLQDWRILETWECVAIACGCLWQMVYDGKFSVGKDRATLTSRLGLIVQTVFALAGIGDAFNCAEPHPLFVGYITGTLLIQGSLFVRWVHAGRPDTLE